MTAITLSSNFRRYELPWEPTDEQRQSFNRSVRTALIIFAIGSLLILLLPRVDRPKRTVADLPERVVQLIVDQPVPPPPEPPPPPKPEVVKPDPTLRPSPTPSNIKVPDTNQKVRNTGMLALQDELADLRDNVDLDQPKPEDMNNGPDVRSERSLITSAVGSASSGINTSAMSRGFGGGAGAIGTHTTTRVPPPSSVIGGRGSDGVRRTGASGKPSRSREEIETVFDRNKGALYALYTRAQRDNAELQGKLVLELTIAASGDVTACRVVSSELKDPELERKIVARVKLFKFEAKDVEPITANKPIDFFPA